MEVSVTTTIKDDGKSCISGPQSAEKKFCRFIPTKETCISFIAQLVILVFLLGALYGVLGKNALPGSEIFALVLLAVCAYAGGLIVGWFRLPPLLGMLAVGILFRNLPWLSYHNDISIPWASKLRDISLVIILLKAGLGLDREKLVTLKWVVFRLSFIPCIAEAAGSAVFSHYLLGLPWLWAFMLGFIVAAVSAAVLVPGALILEEKQLGSRSGIPTLILAAVSIDNIVTLTGFIVFFNVITSNENLTWTLVKRPLEPFVGFFIGAIFGILLWHIPDPKSSKPFLVCCRVLLLCLGGLAFTFVSKRFGVSGMGALACVSFAFVASLNWKTDIDSFKIISWIVGILWLLIEPFLFGLIGAEVTIESLRYNLGIGSLTLFLGVSIRIIFTVLALIGSQLDFKEKIFVSSSWIAKATVQAAVGSQALDFARTQNLESPFEEYGKQVLMMSVLSIILTAPLGAAFIDHLGPYLLKRNSSTASITRAYVVEESLSISESEVARYGSFSQTESDDYSLEHNDKIHATDRKKDINRSKTWTS